MLLLVLSLQRDESPKKDTAVGSLIQTSLTLKSRGRPSLLHYEFKL